jgi:hypothetical protein
MWDMCIMSASFIVSDFSVFYLFLLALVIACSAYHLMKEKKRVKSRRGKRGGAGGMTPLQITLMSIFCTIGWVSVVAGAVLLAMGFETGGVPWGGVTLVVGAFSLLAAFMACAGVGGKRGD